MANTSFKMGTLPRPSRTASSGFLGSIVGNVDDIPKEWKLGKFLRRGRFGSKLFQCINHGKSELLIVEQIPIIGDSGIQQIQTTLQRIDKISSLQNCHLQTIIGAEYKSSNEVSPFHQQTSTSIPNFVGSIQIYMPLQKGPTLKSVLAKNGCLKEPIAMRYIKQIINGISYMHKNDYVHGFIRPSSIHIGNGGKIIVGDLVGSIHISNIFSAPLKQRKGAPDAKPNSQSNIIAERRKEEFEIMKTTDMWDIGTLLITILQGDLNCFGQGRHQSSEFLVEIKKRIERLSQSFPLVCDVLNQLFHLHEGSKKTLHEIVQLAWFANISIQQPHSPTKQLDHSNIKNPITDQSSASGLPRISSATKLKSNESNGHTTSDKQTKGPNIIQSSVSKEIHSPSSAGLESPKEECKTLDIKLKPLPNKQKPVKSRIKPALTLDIDEDDDPRSQGEIIKLLTPRSDEKSNVSKIEVLIKSAPQSSFRKSKNTRSPQNLQPLSTKSSDSNRTTAQRQFLSALNHKDGSRPNTGQSKKMLKVKSTESGLTMQNSRLRGKRRSISLGQNNTLPLEMENLPAMPRSTKGEDEMKQKMDDKIHHIVNWVNSFEDSKVAY